jgi:hypothetical protein
MNPGVEIGDRGIYKPRLQDWQIKIETMSGMCHIEF